MDRLKIAQTNYARIFPGQYQLDEQKSEELETWLQDDVVPIVADLQRLPAFRQNVRFGLSRLVGQADTPERLKVEVVSQALVDAAKEILKFRHLDGESVQNETKKKQPQQHESQNFEESWDITAKIAERPWFDFAVDLDFPCYQHHLYLTTSDSDLEEAFDRFRPGIPILGDGITHLMFARIKFWVHHLQQAWNRVLVRLSTASNPRADFEQFFATKIHLDQCLEDLRSVCLSDNEARMRDACCTLIQVYIAYHPRPQLPWLDLTEDRYQALAGMLRLEFRRLGELIECEQVDSKSIREKNRRSAKLVVIEALQKVAAALEDVASLYRSSLSPEELIDEARFQYRLVVVTKPRMAFFDGDKLNVDWNKKSKPWEMLRYLGLADLVGHVRIGEMMLGEWSGWGRENRVGDRSVRPHVA